METIEIVDELHSLSLDSLDETNQNTAWYGLIKKFSYDQLDSLRTSFKENIKDGKEIGLTKEEFSECIRQMFDQPKYLHQSHILFEDIAKSRTRIVWDDFLDFLLENIPLRTEINVNLHLTSVESMPHMNREIITKIVLLETEKYFSYAIISKHGRIGIYDGNLNFLTSYYVIMTREDLERTDNERRRKNRWVTDAIFCEDIQMLFVANSTRSVAIYEASGLKHEPYWLIMGVHHIIECLSYKNLYHTQSDTKPKCALFAGTSSGDVVVFKFIQPTNSLLRRKHMDRITLFYWDELKYEKLYLKIQFYKAVHNSNVEQMEYCSIENAVISCSKDPNTSLMKKYMSLNKQPYILKMRKGCNCFSFSTTLNILVTGSDDKTIRVWNSVLASNTIAVFTGHQQKIVDVAIMDNQKTILSFSEDGILKLWEINENKCLQTINIEFPAFNILGKRIEFGRRNIYPGAKRSSKYLRYKDNISLHKKYFGISEVEERPKLDEEIRGIHANKWERSNILLTCCNHIASIRTTFEDNNIEKSNDMSILPSPPLQNSVLIPNCWQIPIAELKENNQCNDETGTELNEELTSIIEKDFFDLGTVKTDINYKIAVLEAKKMQMKAHVASGAPYLALDLTEFEELKLSDNLVIPEKKEIKNTIDKIKKRLEDVSMREKAFSEPSSGRSRKSSRSSVISIM